MKILITGAAGFIGANCVKHFSDQGDTVIAFDDLSHKGSADNLEWLEIECPFVSVIGDIRVFADLSMVFAKYGPFDLIIHLAAQTAVTTSFSNPRDDFERNACGSFNLLEAVRLYNPAAAVIYSSTNKVYGSLPNIPIIEGVTRYNYTRLNCNGINERQPIDFHSPYGCSKGCADQYFRDYARMYGLKTVILRQSCIYGPHQIASSDQGWIAWFCMQTALKKPITIYGDGKQVRDALYITDLISLYKTVYANIDKISGEIFNAGGGTENTISILDLITLLTKLSNNSIKTIFAPYRPGDQKIFISDISHLKSSLCWKPVISLKIGIQNLYAWITENIPLLK